MRALMVGGRSGGHIYALLATAQCLQAHDPSAQLRFVGEKGRMEEDSVPRAGYELTTLAMPPASGPVWKRALALPTWLGLVRQSARLIADWKPQIVVGSGGQVGLPVLYAAHRAGLPTILLEPNAIPGWANRVIMRYAKPSVVGLLQPHTEQFIPAGQRRAFTGYPVRPAVLTADRLAGQRALGLDPARKTLLVFGGSQGSGHLNDALCELLPKLSAGWTADWQVLHLGGKINGATLPAETVDKLTVPYHYLPYLNEMEQAMAAADLILGRAGATTMAEAAARGIPAILVPLPGLADNHQVFNAQWMGDAGAAAVVPDPELTPARLDEVLQDLLGDPQRLATMAAASRALGIPDAADRVVALMNELTGASA